VRPRPTPRRAGCCRPVFENGFITQTNIETVEIAANLAGQDGQEGIDAFINKRVPQFRGMH
jgi:1,4-dihydroxy-2-naphthoyl-CoA synthase